MRFTGHSPSSVYANQAIGQQTIQDRLFRLVQAATSWAVAHVLIPNEGSAIAAAIREGRCVSVSEGSYEWLGSRRSELRWLTSLILKFWHIAWAMWDNRNRVLHGEKEHSVARDLQIQQITADFYMSQSRPSCSASLLSIGLLSLPRQQPAYQTAWLIIIIISIYLLATLS
jgi:hypothetical protein